MKLSFNKIKKIFEEEEWHIGYINNNELIQAMNMPIKYGSTGDDNNLINIEYNKIPYALVITQCNHKSDYSLIATASNRIKNNLPELKMQWLCLPIKPCIVMAGMGQYGKNQVVYDYKFGFDCHGIVIGIYNELEDLPIRNQPNWDYLSQCADCDDCYNACPVKAIHNKDKIHWVDLFKCDSFCQFGNDDRIASMKWSWGKYIHYPPLSDDEIKNIKSKQDFYNKFGVNNIGEDAIKLGKIIHVQYPVCRECCSQPKCSKYNGNYPYDKYGYYINYNESGD